MRRLLLIPLVLLSLTGCASMDNEHQEREYQHERDYRLNDGRTLHCLQIEVSYGGMSCDWAHAK